MKHWRIILGIFICLTIFGLFLPFLITQKLWFWDLGRADANEVGDAIGGILGPYFGFIASCLSTYTIYFQIKTRTEDRLKDFEMVIFENSLDSLKSAESKIYDLNSHDLKKKWASNFYFDKYFKSEWNSETLKVHLFIEEINNSLNLFNSNSISSEAFNTIIIARVDKILHLTKANKLGKWNSKERDDNEAPDFFHNLNSLESYNEVKVFYNNIFILKSNFKERFNKKDFQTEKILQLKETCAWLKSFEDELNRYIKKEQEITQGVSKDFGLGL